MYERNWAELAAAIENDDELSVVDGVLLNSCCSRQHESTDANADPRGTLVNREM